MNPELKKNGSKQPHSKGFASDKNVWHVLPTFLLLLSLSICAGCAKIGDPKPPEIRIPVPATDLSVRQLSDFLVLTFSKPERNTNGSKTDLATLKSVDVYRMGAALGSADGEKQIGAEQIIKLGMRVISIPAARFSEYLAGNAFVIKDQISADSTEVYAHTFRYAVLFVNNKNRSTGFSNQVLITPVPIPPPPAALQNEQNQSVIKLRWSAPVENMDGSKPARIAGYNVYRSEQPQKTPSIRINQEPVQGLEFEDVNVRFDTIYYYAISTVGSEKNPTAESLPSTAIAVVSKDIFPPEPAEDFNAVLQGDTAMIVWSPSNSADLAGYRIFRQEKGSQDRHPVQSELIRTTSFRDEHVDPAKDYDYEIEAVDTHGNTSKPVRTALEKR